MRTDETEKTAEQVRAAQQPRTIEVMEDDDVIDWQAQDPDTKEKFESRFKLRIVPNSVQKVFRKNRTKMEFTRQGRQENLDTTAYVEDCLDYAIVGWSGVFRRIRRPDKTIERIELECTRENKSRLPEFVRAQIVQMCVGKELAMMLAGSDEDASAGGGGPAQSPSR